MKMSTIVRYAGCLATLCLVIGLASSAFAVPPEQVLHVVGPFNLSGACCFSFNETISVTEPAKPTAVVVTFEESRVLSEGGPTLSFVVGLMVNGGPCKFYGSGYIPNILEDFIAAPKTFQWVVFPSDGLHSGSNTFTLCGGGPFGASSISLQAITMNARLTN